MAFTKEPTRTPVSVGNIVIHLKDAVGGSRAPRFDPPYQSAHFDVKIVLSDGTVITRHGDLVPHITTAERDWLMQFMADKRAQAEQEILP